MRSDFGGAGRSVGDCGRLEGVWVIVGRWKECG